MLPPPPRLFPNPSRANLRLVFAALFLVHALLLCFDCGRLPPAPVLGDEVIINDPSVSLALGHGLRAESLPGSRFLLDKYYAQFPPVYLLAEAAAIRVFGLSVYSLRSVSIVADLASLAVFLAGLLALIRWRLADPRLTLPIALFAAINPAAIVMSRTARPDSTVYLFATAGFLLLIGALYRSDDEAPATARFPKLLLGALAIGLALATHLEAIPIVVTAGIVILAAASATWLQKLAALAVIPATFLAVCAATFGDKLMLAYRQWQAIVHLDDKIQPGIFNQLRIVRENPRSGGLIFLVVAEAVLLMVAIPLLAAWQRPDTARTPRHRLTLAFAISSVLCLLLMQFVIPGSGHRYVILLPGLLFAFAVALPLTTSSRLPNVASTVFAAVSLAVLALYFHFDRHHNPAFSSHRYDALVDNITATTPPGGRIATSPFLWLAFRERNIPITLIYDPGFDASTPYHDQGPGPLDMFSTIVLSEDDKNYADNAPRVQALPGAITKSNVGKETVDVFRRVP